VVDAVRRRARVAAGVLALGLLALVGCSSTGNGRVNTPEGRMQLRQEQNAQLAGRPTSEERVAELTRAQDAVRVRLEQELGLTRWSDTGLGDGGAGCAEFPVSDGRTASLSGLLLTGGVPDAQWDRAAVLTEQVLRDFGFGAAETVVDNPGEHEVVLRGQLGALVRFGTLANATLALETGCHLPADVAASLLPG
jgi:hypothetical protein